MSMNNGSEIATTSTETMAKLIALENRTGYRMQQFNGQRKFWNPNWDKSIPPRGCEVFVGKIPRDLYEDELVPVFEEIGQIYELRLMMDFSGYNRGYAFVCFTCTEHAKAAIERLDNYEIRAGLRIGVCKSVDNCKLFVNGLPKDKSQQEIQQAMSEVSEDVSDVIVHPGSNPGEKNRGFAFVEYQTHRAAAMARRKLMPGRITIFGSEVVTDWAEPETDMNDTLSRIKNVYVRNLKLTTTESAIYFAFNAVRPNAIERVKKIQDRDYAFVHFLKREDALFAIQAMNGQKIDGQEVQVSLAKPPSNKNDTLNSILQNFSIQKQTAQRSSYPPMVNAVNNNSIVQDRLNSLLLRNPNNIVNQQQHLLNQLTNNYPLMQPQQDLSNPFNRNPQISALSSLQLPSQSLANVYQQQINQKAAAAAALNQLANQAQLAQLQNYSQLPQLNRNSFASPVPFAPTMNNLQHDLMSNPLLQSTSQVNHALLNQVTDNLSPLTALENLAKIHDPVAYLDEISDLFLNGARPVYSVFTESLIGKTFYVFKVFFMGKTYTPTPAHYSEDLMEAKTNAAKYVMNETDPWLWKQISTLLGNGNVNSLVQRNNLNFQRNHLSSLNGRTAQNSILNGNDDFLSSALKQNLQNKLNNQLDQDASSSNGVFNTNSPLWNSPVVQPSKLLSSLAVSAQPEIATRNTLNNGALVGGGDSFLSSSNDKNKQVGVISPPNKAVSSSSILNSNSDNFFHSLLNDDNKLLEDFRSVSIAQDTKDFEGMSGANGMSSLYNSYPVAASGDSRAQDSSQNVGSSGFMALHDIPSSQSNDIFS